MIIELMSWIFIKALMHDILTHGGFGIAGSLSRVGLYLLRLELRWLDVAENDVAGDIPVHTLTQTLTFCSLRRTLVNACLRIHYGLILL